MIRSVKLYLVNLAGEYMDVVLALSLEWIDPRLTWEFDQNIPIREIRVDSRDLWTPKIDLANRIYNFSPEKEIHLKATVGHKGNKNYIIYISRARQESTTHSRDFKQK